jgi:hypothetical protein
MTQTPTTQALSPDEITELRMRQVEDQMYLNGLLEEIGYIEEDLQTEMSEADRTYYEHARSNCRSRAAEVRIRMLVRLKHIS